MIQTQRLAEIRRNLSTYFSDDEIRTLLFDLGIDYDSLPAIGKEGKIRELLALADHTGRISQLLEICRRVRPNVDWRESIDDKANESPFKGLEYFDIADAGLFFGREQLIAKLIGRLKRERFLAVVGASGSGKSSLIRAGVAATILAGGSLVDGSRLPDGSARWLIRIMTPTAQPIEALAAQLISPNEPITNVADFISSARLHPDRLHLQANRQLAQLSQASARTHERILLIVDQFEELFTLCHNEADRRAFVDNLLYAVQFASGNVIVILTLRADFYSQCAAFETLRDILAAHQEYIGPMKRDELKRAIEEPARRSGYEFERGLVDTLLNDIGNEPGTLPLLSHALFETWKERDGRTLTLNGYFSSGGLRGAIAKTADDVYESFSPQEQAITRSIFLRLTELGEGAVDTRRRVRLDELVSRSEDIGAVRNVLRRLTNQETRLITTSANDIHNLAYTIADPSSKPPDLSPLVEVAHEALIREWQRLRGWLDEDRDALRTHRQLTEAAETWLQLNHDEGALFRGIQLAKAVEWATTHSNDLNRSEREFLDASQALLHRETADKEAKQQYELEAAQKLAETERKQAADQRITFRRTLILITLFAIAASGLAGWAFIQTNQARIAAREAETQRIFGRSREIASLVTSQIATGQDPERILLLAIEAVTVTHKVGLSNTFEAENALRHSLYLARTVSHLVGHDSSVYTAQFSPDGRQIVTASGDWTARVWDAATGKQLALLSGHTDAVFTAQFSPDGRQIVTASHDGTARVWDAATGKQLALLSGHTSPVRTAQFSPDGKQIVTASDDRTARVWDATTGKQLALLSGHDNLVNTARFSPDGKQIVTASYDLTARVWDAATGKQLALLSGHTGTVYSAQFSPDGRQIVTASYDLTAQVWDAATGKQLALLSGHTSFVRTAQFSPDGRQIVTASGDQIARVWDAATGKQLALLSGHTGAVHAAQFSPDGRQIVTSSDDRTARVWDAATGKQLALLSGHTGAVHAAQFSPDGKQIVTSSDDRTARVWDAATGKQLALLSGHTGAVYTAQFSPDGKQIVTSSDDRTARVWDAATGKQLVLLSGHTSTVRTAQFSPDGKQIVTASYDRTARVWDAATGKQLALLSGHTGAVFTAQFSPDGKQIVTSSDDRTARVWDAATGKQLALLSGHTSTVRTAQFSPDGKQIVTASDDRTARVWDAATGKQLALLSGHTDATNTAQFSPDGKQIVTASGDRTARVWDAATGKQLALLSGHTDATNTAQFSPDGTKIVTASYDWTARVWDAATGKQLALLFGHNGFVFAAQFSSDGKQIVTASDDRTARVWDAATGKQLALLSGHDGVAYSAQFTPDSKKIVTASLDKTAMIHLVTIEDLVTLAQSRLIRQLSCQERVNYLNETLNCTSAQ